jgi:hypothetical protein
VSTPPCHARAAKSIIRTCLSAKVQNVHTTDTTSSSSLRRKNQRTTHTGPPLAASSQPASLYSVQQRPRPPGTGDGCTREQPRTERRFNGAPNAFGDARGAVPRSFPYAAWCLPARSGHQSPLTQLRWTPTAYSLFARLMSHRAEVLFSRNKSATNNQSAVLLSQQTSTSHQPPANRTGCNTEHCPTATILCPPGLLPRRTPRLLLGGDLEEDSLSPFL